jgi:hypothetical protein
VRAFLCALAAVLLVATPAVAKPKGGGLTLVDLTEDFGVTWERTEPLPDAERVAAFKRRFASLLPGFYSEARLGQPAEKYDARLLARLKDWPEQKAGIEGVARQFDGMFQPALKTFESRFGPMRGYAPIYLVHSLGEFDGGTRRLPQGVVLLFGADMIARYHATGAIQPFFHHELFHLYHSRFFAECEQVWCSLWTEGLAVHVAKTLNPSATDDELLLTQPGPIRPEVDADRTAAVCAVVARLDSADPQAAEALFSFRRLGPGLPPRFGYYVGYLAAAEMGRTRSPQQLARMPAAQVRAELEKALRGLATCPTAVKV